MKFSNDKQFGFHSNHFTYMAIIQLYQNSVNLLLTSVTFTLHPVFYCDARTWVVIGCQRDLLLLGRLLWMNLRRTRCKLRLSRDTLVKGLQNLIIVDKISNTVVKNEKVCGIFLDFLKLKYLIPSITTYTFIKWSIMDSVVLYRNGSKAK